MFVKFSYSNNSIVQPLSKEEIQESLASPEILDRLEKFAQKIQSVGPRSDDFLYFTIIFMKAAESCLIDDIGNLKKIGNEKAWGYFDDRWIWQGNVKPHRNSNLDIFPENQLKVAARGWIGKPLCV